MVVFGVADSYSVVRRESQFIERRLESLGRGQVAHGRDGEVLKGDAEEKRRDKVGSPGSEDCSPEQSQGDKNKGPFHHDVP